MAVIDRNGNWRGKVGNNVYRTVGSTQVVQIKPSNVRQTTATRESALEFGLASSAAMDIRYIISPAFHTTDRGMPNRLTNCIRRCMSLSGKKRGERDIHDGDVSVFKGFQFNKNSPLSTVLLAKPLVNLTDDRKVQVGIPGFNTRTDLKRPSMPYSGINLQIMVTAFHFRSGYSEYLGFKEQWIGRGVVLSPSVEWKSEKEVPPGSLVLVTVSLNAESENCMRKDSVNTKEWSPAEIVEAFQIPQGETPLLELSGRTLTPGEAEGRHLVEFINEPLMKMRLAYDGNLYFEKIRALRNGEW
ncbi:hypothetical protein [Pararcticibacter amylolyticus]|uniref:Uncharacterized protein n=1 Tax=Pararcticibacter amylolyticus TaxID=2173175 RepID=A0A2U2PJ48_9SPHI|nr:hypothetical protein [Pararcticibacter amylolyticus]PWG81427.1 hypothetical protein DDR33_06220 [Pararcticibacter amylolyticus]